MSLPRFIALGCAVLSCSACVGSLGQGQAQDEVLSTGPVLARFTFRSEAELVILPVTFKGKEYPFCLDTGATHTIFDLSLLLGEHFETQTVTGAAATHEIRMYARPEATMGPIPLTGYDRIGGFDMHKLRRAAGQNLMGIVGLDALAGRVVQIDFDRGQVLFLAAIGSDAGLPFPVIIDDGRAYIMARVNGNEQRFFIDTGDSGFGTGSLATPLFDELYMKGQITNLDEVNSETSSGTHSSRIGRFKELTLGEFKVALPYVSKSKRNRLGIGFWSRFVVTFDLRSKNKQVYLKPGKRYNQLDVFDCSGMTVVLEGEKVTVHSVNTDSPSAKAGVREGDELWMLGTKRATEVGLQPVRRALCAAGTTVPLVLRRDGQEVAVSLALPAEQKDGKK